MPGSRAHSVDGDSGQEESRPSLALTLQFVSMNVSCKAEKERNQKVIRSTAMKNFRRRQQSQRIHGKEVSKTSGETGQSPRRVREASTSDNTSVKNLKQLPSKVKKERDIIPDEEPSQAVESSAPLSAFPKPWPEGQEISCSNVYYGPLPNEVDYIDCSQSDLSSNDSFSLGSPVTLLGGGRIDPFRVYPYSSPHVHELIDHSISLLWPGLRPHGSDGVANRISSVWLEKVCSTPLVMHAMLFGGAVHMEMLQGPRIDLNNPIRLFHKIQTMRLLKEELKNPGISDPEEVILAILTLGTSEIETLTNFTNSKSRPPFNSPISSMQWLDVYGSLMHIKAHTLAMRSLVDRRGGLEMIELEGLAEVLEL